MPGIQELSPNDLATVTGGNGSTSGGSPGDTRDLATGASSAAGAAAGSRFGGRGATFGATVGGYLGGMIYDIAETIDISQVSDPMDAKIGIRAR